MAELANKQHEEYAFAVAMGLSKSEAARRAGYTDAGSIANRGSRLWKRDDIRNRVAEIQTNQRTYSGPVATKEWTVLELIQTHRLARIAQQHSVSVQALLAVAKLNGHLVEKRETYAEKLNIHELRAPGLTAAIERELKQLPEAERVAILDAEPAVAELLNPPSIRQAEAPEQQPAIDDAQVASNDADL